MKAIVAALQRIIAGIITSIFKNKQPASLPCQFCGASDHDADHCPNAAKYKLFHIDRE